MITAIDLFDRPAITGKEKRMVVAANQTARNIFERKESGIYKDTLPEDASMFDIEVIVIQSLRNRRKCH